MIRHLAKLVWNRKRANALLIVEIFFSFLVVAIVATAGMSLAANARRTLGYDWRDVWEVQVGMEGLSSGAVRPEHRAALGLALRELEASGQVEAAAAVTSSPYRSGTDTQNWTLDDATVSAEMSFTTPHLDRVLGLELVAGRWLEAADETLPWRPAVIDRDLAARVFGDADPLGKLLHDPDVGSGELPTRVVGVVREYRRSGELSVPNNYFFLPVRLGDPEERLPRTLLLRMAPGTPAAYEEELIGFLQRLAPDLSFEVRPLAAARRSYFRWRLAPLVAGGTVAAFLIVMVGLGLVGVVWQNVVQRTREIGLRRAAGASRGAIYGQVLGEQLVLATLGILLGVAVAVQLPLLDLLGNVRPGAFAAGLAAAAGVVYLLAAACSLYPSRLASRIEPAEALRHD